MDLIYVWLIIVALLLIIELLTISLMTIWFVASGIITIFLSFYIDNYLIQFFVFVVLGIILLLTTRNYLLEKIHQKRTNISETDFIGKEGKVLKTIKKNEIGEVKVAGQIWFATAKKDIELDEIVKVKRIKNNCLIVTQK